MSELIWVIPLSIAMLILMIILGVTLVGILTGNIGGGRRNDEIF